MIIAAKINCGKIDKAKLYKGDKGTYLDIVLMENRDGPDQYGNDFMVVQSVTKEERLAGKKGAILGNAKFMGVKQPEKPPGNKPANEAPPAESADSEIPF